MPRTNEPVDVFQFIRMRGPDECWPWLGTWGGRSRDRRPYFQADGVRTMAYRWVWKLVHGELADDQLILHSCDNGGFPIGCCNPHHLRPGSVAENTADMMERERHGLPRTVTKAIRTLLDMGRTQQSIAELYGISRESVSALANGRTYKRDGATAPAGRERDSDPERDTNPDPDTQDTDP